MALAVRGCSSGRSGVSEHGERSDRTLVRARLNDDGEMDLDAELDIGGEMEAVWSI